MQTGREKKIPYGIVFLFFACVYMLFSSGHYGGDGFETYLTAKSLVLERDFSIDSRDFDVKEFTGTARGTRGADGAMYAKYALGMPFVLVPFYLIGYIASLLLRMIPHDYVTQLFVSCSNPVISAGTSCLLFRFLLKIGYRPKISFVTTLIYSFCTMAFVYSKNAFAEPLVGLLALASAYSLYCFVQARSCTHLALSSFYGAYAVLVKKNSLILLICIISFAVYHIIVHKEDLRATIKAFLALFLPVAAAVAIMLLFNKAIYGGMFHTEWGSIPAIAGRVSPRGIFVTGLYYYFFSSGKSLFLFNIPLILACFGMRAAFVRDNKNANLYGYLIAVIVAHIIFYASIFERGSLFSWGPRYLLPILPIFFIFLASFMSDASGAYKKWLVAVAAVFGFLVQVPALFVNPSKYLFFLKEKLNVDEYMVNYIPHLSPVKGSWMLFFSSLRKIFTGGSLDFTFNPDYIFIAPRTASMRGYDSLDLWVSNIIGVREALAPLVFGLLVVLVGISVVLFARLTKQIGRHRLAHE